ncbi:MAG: histidinol dehydrogenase [Thermoanaerobaculales bacterium]
MGRDRDLIRVERIDTTTDVAPFVARVQASGRPIGKLATGVAAILRDVRLRGDEALVEQVRAHDWPIPSASALRVSPDTIALAWRRSSRPFKSALKSAADSVRSFHARQRPANCRALNAEGVRAGLKAFPLDSVGLYVPGGLAAYPSTLLMLAIPAQLAGVGRIAVATPAGPNGSVNRSVLAAAHLLKIDEVFALGGAAAVAAFAFGTPTVPRVDKVLGPGNAYVAEAKRQVFGFVGIDSIAGPTELVVLSDGSSPAAFIAADLLAQAEHDPMASPILLTTQEAEPARVISEFRLQLVNSPRGKVQRESLANRGAIAVCANRALACEAARLLAPEHLSIQTRKPAVWAKEVPSAAALFLGPYAPEAAGDYGAGPNHSLPTGGTARFSSPVGVWDFVRYQSYLEMDRASLKRASSWMKSLAKAEGLFGHARSLRVREARP